MIAYVLLAAAIVPVAMALTVAIVFGGDSTRSAPYDQ